MKLSRIFLLSIPCLLLFAVAHAQGVPSSVGGLELSISSDNPAPGQTVTISAQSYSTDINAATLIWSMSGKAVQQGIGLTSYQVKAPALGKKLTVNVVAVTPEGRRLANSVTMGSGAVDMIAETDGYVPPFFHGKIMPVYQNIVKIVAMPHLANPSGVEYGPKDLVYQWKKDDRVLQDQSGYGKQSISLAGDIVPRPYIVTVKVSNRDGSAQAAGTIRIEMGKPSIGFYVDDPLYGALFNRAVIDSIRIGSEKETDVLAVPFGFNKPAQGLGDLSLIWTLNGLTHEELGSSQSVVLRAPEDTSGSSGIQLEVRNGKQILQGADGAFSAFFTSGASTASPFQ